MFNQKDLVSCVKANVNIEGFEFSEENQGVFLKKALEDRVLSIYIGYSGYPDRYYLQSPYATISFTEIEDKMLNLNIPSKFTFNNYTCRYLCDEKNNSSKLQDISITSKNDFEQVARLLKPIILDIMSFFKSQDSLIYVENHLDSLEMKKAVEFLGQPFPLRKMALLFLTNKSKYIEFSEKVRVNYKQSDSPLFDSAMQLIERLETTSQKPV